MWPCNREGCLPSIVTQLSTLLGAAGPQAATTIPSGSGQIPSQKPELWAQPQHPLADCRGSGCSQLTGRGRQIPNPGDQGLTKVSNPELTSWIGQSHNHTGNQERGTWGVGHGETAGLGAPSAQECHTWTQGRFPSVLGPLARADEQPVNEADPVSWEEQ